VLMGRGGSRETCSTQVSNPRQRSNTDLKRSEDAGIEKPMKTSIS
jgi:hypothetical protein